MSFLNKNFLFVFFIFFSTTILAQPKRTIEQLSAGPEDNSARSLKKWRFFLADYLTSFNGDSSAIKVENKNINNLINSCYQGEKPECLEDIEYFSYVKANPEDYNTSKYEQPGQDKLVIKSTDDLPNEFRIRGKDGKFIPNVVTMPVNIEEIVKAKGWKSALYKTKSSGGFDGSMNLYIVAVPLGVPPNEWDKVAVLQTSPKSDHNESIEHNLGNPLPNPANGDFTNANDTLTVLTLDKTRKPAQSFMRMFSQSSEHSGNSNNDRVSYGWNNESVASVSTCMGCHTGPFKPISPMGHGGLAPGEEPLPDKELRRVSELNKILEEFVGWGTIDVNGREFRRGPAMDTQPLGWAPRNSVTRTEDWLAECAKKRRSISYDGFGSYSRTIVADQSASIRLDKLKDAMNCYSCHNGIQRGVLHENFNQDEIDFKVAVHKTMPRGGVELTDDENLALLACLKKEKSEVRDEWKKSGEWMKLRNCTDSTLDHTCPKPEVNLNTNTENQSSSGSIIE